MTGKLGNSPSIMQGPSPPVLLKTQAFAHYGVAWSPFHPQLLALASSANYGLVGNGRLYVISRGGGQAAVEKRYYIPSLTAR